MKKIKKDKEFIIRTKSFGALGELIAMKTLVDNNFERIQNLNDQKKNFPYGDLLAKKGRKRYVISVKSRNKYQRDGTLNSNYKLGKNCYENAKAAEKQYDAEPYWMAIQFDGNRYSVYFGSLAQLNGKKGIPMNVQHLSNYKCLSYNQKHGIDFRPFLNIYKEDEPNNSVR